MCPEGWHPVVVSISPDLVLHASLIPFIPVVEDSNGSVKLAVCESCSYVIQPIGSIGMGPFPLLPYLVSIL
jgi:hypothetical protein